MDICLYVVMVTCLLVGGALGARLGGMHRTMHGRREDAAGAEGKEDEGDETPHGGKLGEERRRGGKEERKGATQSHTYLTRGGT
jgi:hypothetical protein